VSHQQLSAAQKLTTALTTKGAYISGKYVLWWTD
jgi:hypothetical protein